MLTIAGGIIIAVIALIVLGAMLKFWMNWCDYPSEKELELRRDQASKEFSAKYPASVDQIPR